MFSHDDTPSAPIYTVSISNGYLTTPPQQALIDFDAKPVLINNRLTINQGQTVIFTGDNLYANHTGGANAAALRFFLSDIQHGQFAWVTLPNQPITEFQQQNITDRRVQFTQDNSINTPHYLVAVSDGRVTSDSEEATIDFDTTPVLLVNQLQINQGESVLLTSDNLLATHPGGSDSNLNFMVSNVQHGWFKPTATSNQTLTQFQQQNITDQRIWFMHDDLSVAPSYQITVSDGRITTTPAAGLIDFDARPLLVKNTLSWSRKKR